MPTYELFRHDITLLKAANVSDSRQIPAAGATLDLYWKGARVSSGSSGTVGHVVAVYDPGTVSVSDVVAKNGVGTTGTVTAVTATSITITWGALVTVATGDRLVILTRALGATRPLAHSDPQGTVSLGSQVTTGSNGLASFYTRPKDIDLVATVDGQTQVLADQTGQGNEDGFVFDFGLVADGVTDDAAALNRLIGYIGLKGKTKLELPAATIRVNSSIVLSTSAILMGAGRSATILQGTAGLTPVLDVSSDDSYVLALSVRRTATGSAGTRLINVSGLGCSFRNLDLRDGAIGIRDNGVFNTFDDISFSGSGWEAYFFSDQSVGFHCYSLRGASDTAIAAANAAYILDGAQDGRLTNCTAELTGVVTGRSVLIRQTGAAPTGLTFVGCKFSAANVATATQPVVSLTAGQGIRFVACDLVDGLAGYHFNGAGIEDVQIMGGSCVSMRENSVDIDAGSHIHIVELLSSDNNLANNADHRADHINIAANVNDVSVVGLTAGRIVVGGGPQGRYAVRVEAGTGARIQVMGVRGIIADLSAGWVGNASTSQELDIGHNVESGNNRSYTHTSTPGAEVMGGLVGTKTVTAAVTTTDVRNVDTLILNQAGPQTWTDLTFGREGQVVKIVQITAAVSTTFQHSGGGNFRLAGGANVVLGQADTLTVMNAGGIWYQIATSNNVP